MPIKSDNTMKVGYFRIFILITVKQLAMQLRVLLREAIKKKTRKFWTLFEKGGGSALQPNFLSEKSRDMCKVGERGGSRFLYGGPR